VVNAVNGDAPSEPLAGTFDSWDVKMGQEIVDPLVVGTCRKSSYVNVIVPRHNLSYDQRIN
jgi:hypothetical protein